MSLFPINFLNYAWTWNIAEVRNDGASNGIFENGSKSKQQHIVKLIEQTSSNIELARSRARTHNEKCLIIGRQIEVNVFERQLTDKKCRNNGISRDKIVIRSTKDMRDENANNTYLHVHICWYILS